MPSQSEMLASLQQSLKTIRNLKAQLAATEEKLAGYSEPIAIVGMSGRFPGAPTLEAFWQLLYDGVDAIIEVPEGRREAWDGALEGASHAIRYAGFLEKVDQFDPLFFGISPREAVSMDPQQRLLLEVSWEALERAGMAASRDRLATTQTGVFVGITSTGYASLLASSGTELGPYFTTGNTLNAAAGRLSYTLGLQGPCMAIDTACSSSLVAIHQAVMSLRHGECDQALAGGVNLVLSPGGSIALAQAGMLSPDARCQTFSLQANGYVRGEGCGMLVLKRLSDAQADGDQILALIRGSATNQDGPSSGLTVPNGPAQQALYRKALQNANVAPEEVTYIEAHGTGTSLGDPIEVRNLGMVFGHRTHPLLIGSVKTNIGHLESAAGVAGLMKVVLSLQNETIPAHLHFNEPSSHINWDAWPVMVPTESMPWPPPSRPPSVPSIGGDGGDTSRGEGRRIAGVSSFGASGTNAHIILEAAPTSNTPNTPNTPNIKQVVPESAAPLSILTLSAKTQSALRELASRYERYLAITDKNPSHASDSLANICFTTHTGRAHFEHRLAVLAQTKEEAQEKLTAFVAGDTSAVSGVLEGQLSESVPQIAFLFTGQSFLPFEIVRELYEIHATFRFWLDRCDKLLRPLLKYSLLSVLDSENLRKAPTNSILFALDYALAQLWLSWGIKPTAVMGVGVGEMVAACVAGIFSLEDGLKLASASTSTFEHVVKAITYSEPQIGLLSTLTGTLVKSADLIHARYVSYRHASGDAGRVASGMNTLLEMGIDIFVEIGFSMSAFREAAGRQNALFVGANEPDATLATLYVHGVPIDWAAFERHRKNSDAPPRRVELPTYPFQRERYWFKGSLSRQLRWLLEEAQGVHPLLGKRLHLARHSPEICFESKLSPDSPAYLTDHRVYGTAILPATAYFEMALAAGREIFGSDHFVLEEVFIQQPLVLEPDTTHEFQTVQLILSPLEGGERGYWFEILSQGTDENESEPIWRLHAEGQLLAAPPQHWEGADLAALQAVYIAELPVNAYYQLLQEGGLEYGPNFQAIRQLWYTEAPDEGGALGLIQLPEELLTQASAYQLHPVLLDACSQLLGAAFPTNQEPDDGGRKTYVPVGLERLQLYRSGGNCWSQATSPDKVWGHVQPHPQLPEELDDFDSFTSPLVLGGTEGGRSRMLKADLHLFDEHGEVVALLEGLSLRRATPLGMLGERAPSEDYREWLHEQIWVAHDAPADGGGATHFETGDWLIFTEQGAIGRELTDQLAELGARCILVSQGQAYSFEADGDEGRRYVINPFAPDDYERLFDELHEPVHGVLYLCGSEKSSLPQSALEHSSRLLYLVQALTNGHATPPRLYIVTQGTQAIAQEPPETAYPAGLAQAPLWGMGRVIAMEHPQLLVKRIDLAAFDTQQNLFALLHELSLPASDREDQVAYREGVRYVARLARYATDRLPTEQQIGHSLAIEPHGSYLITGGLGALGLLVANWLVEQGAKHLVLVGRRGIKEKEQQEAVNLMATAGTQVCVVKADVSKREDIARALDTAQSLAPLRGVIHAAGVLDDGILQHQSRERFEKVMRPKVHGAWHLHHLTAHLKELDFFVCYSSVASLLGSPGQGNYAAANAFMDALAHYRHALGLPALSINWGPFSPINGAGGMTSRQSGPPNRWAQVGMSMIAPEQGLQALAELLQADLPQVGVVPVKWQTYQQQYPPGFEPPLLERVIQSRASQERPSSRRLKEQLQDTPAEERHSLLHHHLRVTVANVLGLSSFEQVQAHTRLFDLGLDSLMALELRGRLEFDLERPLRSTLLFDYPTVNRLTGYLATQVLTALEVDAQTVEDAPAEEAPPDADDALASDFEDLSLNELEALLAQELDF